MLLVKIERRYILDQKLNFFTLIILFDNKITVKPYFMIEYDLV